MILDGDARTLNLPLIGIYKVISAQVMAYAWFYKSENFCAYVKSSFCAYVHLHLHLVIWQTLLSKATYNWGVHKAIHLEEAVRQRKCS